MASGGVGERGPEDRDQADRENEERKGQPGVGQPHDQLGRGRRDSSRRTRPSGTPIAIASRIENTPACIEMRAPHTTRERAVAPQIVGAERMRPGRRLADLAPVGLHRIGRRRSTARRTAATTKRQHDQPRPARRPAAPAAPPSPGQASRARRRPARRPATARRSAAALALTARAPKRGCAGSAAVYEMSTSRLISTYDDGGDEHHALHERVVAGEHRLDDQAAEARARTKICSVTTAPPMSAPICRPRIVTTGIESVAERVAQHDRAAGQPLGCARCGCSRRSDLDHRCCASGASARRPGRCRVRAPA